MLVDGHEADQQPEDSGEAAQPEEQKQEVQELQELQEVQEVQGVQGVQVRQRHTENEVSEVDIPNVGRITVRADADGYNEEVNAGSPNACCCSFVLLCLFFTAVCSNR